jgi:hypothetical protein
MSQLPVEDFHSRVANENHDDGSEITLPDEPTMRRFLVARKHDVALAVAQYVDGKRGGKYADFTSRKS